MPEDHQPGRPGVPLSPGEPAATGTPADTGDAPAAHAPAPASALVPGALLMAVGADVLQLLTTYWIGHLVARKTSTYGAVGIALAVLLWVYVLGRIVVGSAGLNAALWYRRERPRSAP